MQLDALRVFVKVAELSSFTRAAQHLGLSKPRVSVLVQELEVSMGTRLLQRSTRAMRLTSSGEQFLPRARRLLADAESLAAMFQGPSTLGGHVRVDMPQALARAQFIPRLPTFLAAHPQIELSLSTTDARVDLLREGFDCVLRIGQLRDSGLVAQRLGALPVINVASPAYLARRGVPRTLSDLDQHVVVHYSLRFGADRSSFDYVEGVHERELPMRCLLTVNSTDSYTAACLAGLGIIQAPRHGLEAHLDAGDLVEVLPAHVPSAMPVSLVHAYSRSVPKHVRAVLQWIAQVISPHLT